MNSARIREQTVPKYDVKAREQGQFAVSGTKGLYYLRSRYYDPTIGRFLTRDPLPGSTLAPQSLNPYPYVQNNPVNRVDPTGMLSEGAEIVDCQAALLFGAIAMLMVAYVAIGLGASIFIPYGFMLVTSEAATFATIAEGIHLMIAGGIGAAGGGVLAKYGLLTLWDACSGGDARHGVTE